MWTQHNTSSCGECATAPTCPATQGKSAKSCSEVLIRLDDYPKLGILSCVALDHSTIRKRKDSSRNVGENPLVQLAWQEAPNNSSPKQWQALVISESGQIFVGKFGLPMEPLVPASSGTSCISLSPDGRILAKGLRDRIILQDASQGVEASVVINSTVSTAVRYSCLGQSCELPYQTLIDRMLINIIDLASQVLRNLMAYALWTR